MQIGILNYEFAVPTSVTGPADIFASLANNYPVVTGKSLKTQFDIDFIKPETLPTTKTYDLVIIPAMFSNMIETVVQKEVLMIDWLRQQYAKNTELASICVGSFLLAATGLLNGRPATTNWMFADRFRQLYPKVLLQNNKIIVDNGRLYTCGGAFSFTTFMIYLIEKFCCREVAVTASKILMIDVRQQPLKAHCDDAVARIQLYLETHYNKHITMEEMAGICNMSPRNFSRRFERATSNTPLEYLQRYRIENAKKMLETPNESIERIAMDCGYEDISFFRKIFRRHVGMTPKEYKQKYGRGLPGP